MNHEYRQTYLSNFIANTQIDREVGNIDIVLNFLYDMKFNLIHGDKESNRYVIIKHSYEPNWEVDYKIFDVIFFHLTQMSACRSI